MQSHLKDLSSFTTMLDYSVHWAKVIPNDEAFVFRRQDGIRYSLTWSNYLHLGTQFAARLQKMGIVKGDIICNYLVNSPERVVTELGTMLAGAVPMHGETLFADKADVREILNKAKVRAVILDPDQNSEVVRVCEGLLKHGPGESEKSSSESENNNVIYSRRDAEGKMLLFEDLEASTDVFTPTSLTGEDFGYIFTTSGSTGFSKLVLHTHSNLLQLSQLQSKIGTLLARSRHFTDHSCGWIPGSISQLVILGTSHVMTDFRSGYPTDYPAFIWDGIAQEQCHTASMTASHIQKLFPTKTKGFVLDVLSTGGQPIHRGLLDVLASENGFTRQLIHVYGMTETLLTSTVLLTDANKFEEYLAGDYPLFPVKIVDDNLQTLPAGSKGEILTKTPIAFKQYLGDPEKTKEVFTDDGWIRTNDLGYLDDRGRLFVLGRCSDAIMKGLCVVFPSWLETRIRQCPGVADVVVVPVPDKKLHHEICACVVKKDGYDLTKEDLDSFCQNLFVSGLDESEKFNPKYFVFFDSFPVNKNGKTDRKRIERIAVGRTDVVT